MVWRNCCLDMGFYDRGSSCMDDCRCDVWPTSRDVRTSERLFDRHWLSDRSQCIGMVGISSRYGLLAVRLCEVKVPAGPPRDSTECAGNSPTHLTTTVSGLGHPSKSVVKVVDHETRTEKEEAGGVFTRRSTPGPRREDSNGRPARPAVGNTGRPRVLYRILCVGRPPSSRQPARIDPRTGWRTGALQHAILSGGLRHFVVIFLSAR